MNWSHALLIIAILSGTAAFFALTSLGVALSYEDERLAHKWVTTCFIITVISGALAAGLWK